MSPEKVSELISYLQISEGSKVLDVGCGKGEFLLLLSNQIDIEGIGVDLSPYFVAQARDRVAKMELSSRLEFVESDGKAYSESVEIEFDVTVCMGASWIYGGHKGTLEALQKITKKGGLILAGEPYWKKEPSERYQELGEMKYEDYSSYEGNIEIAQSLGLRPVYTLDSSLDDWDRYEWLQSFAADKFILDTPSDPDVEEVRKKLARTREAYITEGRNVLGWAIYVFRNA